MTTEAQREQIERRETLRNDLSVRRQQQPPMFAPDQTLPNQPTTLHQHAQSDADIPRGRFSAVETAFVVGSKSDVAGAYPAAGPHQADPCGPEPPLGYSVNDLDPSMAVSPVPPTNHLEPSSSPVMAAPTDGDPGDVVPPIGVEQRGSSSLSKTSGDNGEVRSPVRLRRF